MDTICHDQSRSNYLSAFLGTDWSDSLFSMFLLRPLGYMFVNRRKWKVWNAISYSRRGCMKILNIAGLVDTFLLFASVFYCYLIFFAYGFDYSCPFSDC